MAERAKEARMITDVVFPAHREYQEDEEFNVAEMTYSFSFQWRHKNHMHGTDADEEYIIEKLNKYHDFEIEQKIKQLVFYYQKATGARKTDHELRQRVDFVF